MTSRFRFGVLLVAAMATCAFSSSAFAKGGGGGGKACATLDGFANTPGAGVEGASVTTTYSVFNGCVDEHMSSIAIDFRNETTGFVWTFRGHGVLRRERRHASLAGGLTRPATRSRSRCMRRTGSVQATRSQTVTTPGAPLN